MSGSSGWAISHPPSDEDEVDEKPICQYGARCYRKNPAHLAEFSHPKRADVDEEEKPAAKKPKESEEPVKRDEKRKDSGRIDVPKREDETVKRPKVDEPKPKLEESGKRPKEEAKVKDEGLKRPKDEIKPKPRLSEDGLAKVKVDDLPKPIKPKIEDPLKEEVRRVESLLKPKTAGTPKAVDPKSEVKELPPVVETEQKDGAKPICKYGIKCFRKNLVHFAEYDHPIAGGTTVAEPARKESEREEDPKKAKSPPAKKQKLTDPDDVWPSSEDEADDGVELPPGLTRSYSSMTEKERKQLIADAIKAKARMEEEMKKKEADLIEQMKKKEADLINLLRQKDEQEKKSAEVEKLLKMKGQEADSLRKKGEEASLILKAHQEESQRILKAKQEAEEQLKQTKKAAQHLLKKKDEAVQKEKERAGVLIKQKEAEAETKLAAVTAEAKKKWDDYKEQLKKDLIKAQESLRQGSGVSPMLVKGEAEALENSKTVLFPLYAQRTHDNSAEQAHFRLAESQFYRLLENNDYRVTMVEYVVSPTVVARYKKAIAALTALRAKDMTADAVRKLKEGQAHTEARCVLDPVLGFHGTATKNITSICEHGFKVPGGTEGFTHSTDAGWYGRGVYFSEFPSYAMEYITSGTKLLLCQVVLGKIYHCTKLIHGAPLQAGYDSHMSPDGKEVVIFNSEHILPSYVVHYTKKTGLFEYSRPKPTSDDAGEEEPWRKSKDASSALEHAKKKLAAKGDEESKVFKGVVFVTCGKLLLSVKAMNEMLEEFAGSVAANVSSEVSFVLSTQDEVNKKGPKILQAITKKVPILDQAFAFDCIRNGRYDYKIHQDYLLPVPP